MGHVTLKICICVMPNKTVVLFIVEDHRLYSLDSRVFAADSVNADNAKHVSGAIVADMEGQNVIDYTSEKTNQVVTMSSKFVVCIGSDTVDIELRLLLD